jgi:tyrosine-protein kinase Etk/Wzc
METQMLLPSFDQATDTVNFGEIFSLLRRRAGIIALFTIGAATLMALHVLFATPQFSARGALYLGDTETAAGASSPQPGPGFLSDFSNQSDVETQIELITAGALIQQSILQTGLNAAITPAGSRPLTYWRWRLQEHGQTSAFLPGATTLEALYANDPGHYTIVLGQDDSYTLYTRPGWLEKRHIVLQGVLGKPAAGNGNQMLIQPAGPGYKFVPGQSYNLDITSAAALADSVAGHALSVMAGGSVTQPTKIAFLQFIWPNPYQAQAFVNQLMKNYIASQLEWNTQAASTTESFVAGQLAHVSSSLAAADRNLADYQSKTGIVDVSQNGQQVINQEAAYNTQRTTLQLQQEALQQLNNELTQTQGALNPYLLSQTNDPVLAGLTSRLSDAMVKLNQIEVQYTPSSEEVQLQQAQVDELQRSIKTIARNDLAAVNKSLASLDAIITKFESANKTIPAESLNVISLKRSADVLGQIYILLMEKDEEAQVSKAATIISTRIVTPADMPLSVTSPKALIMVVFGAFAGLVAGVGLVFGQRAFSGHFESEEQIRLSLHLPVYGAVPRRLNSDINTNIVSGIERNPFSESFRLLKGSVQRDSLADKVMVVTIISAWKDDGKTTVAVNLAKSLAQDAKRVLLVDGDVHLSRLKLIPRLGARRGLTDWLVTGKAPKIGKWPDEKFDVLPAGRARAAADISEATFSPIIASLADKYDFIIIDSPPLPTVSDGMVFGAFADLILSVVSVSHTPRQTLAIHNELIKTLNRPHGIIINEVQPQTYGQSDAYFMPEAFHREKFNNAWLLARNEVDRVSKIIFKTH